MEAQIDEKKLRRALAIEIAARLRPRPDDRPAALIAKQDDHDE